jgi:DNA-binding response OmpR family regulator
MMSKILIIDDNKDFLALIEAFLSSEGYNVKTLANPHKAEEYIEGFNPDLLIIDVFMPERSGFNIIEDFIAKGVYQDIPKIFLTGLDDEVEKMTAKGIGVSEYITKPVIPSELSRVIESILEAQTNVF